MGSFVMLQIEVTCEPNKALQYIFNFLPSYAMGDGLVRVRCMRTVSTVLCSVPLPWVESAPLLSSPLCALL